MFANYNSDGAITSFTRKKTQDDCLKISKAKYQEIVSAPPGKKYFVKNEKIKSKAQAVKAYEPPELTARQRRKRDMPSVADQLGAIMDMLNSGDDTAAKAMAAKCAQVKADNPIEE